MDSGGRVGNIWGAGALGIEPFFEHVHGKHPVHYIIVLAPNIIFMDEICIVCFV